MAPLLTRLRDSIVGSCASILDPHPRDKVLDVLLASGLEPTEVGADFVKYADEVAVGPSDDFHVGFLRKLCSYDQGKKPSGWENYCRY